MNVTCPHCATVFRVDPSKVPPDGVRARCSICRGVFRVEGSRRSAPAEPGPVAALIDVAVPEPGVPTPATPAEPASAAAVPAPAEPPKPTPPTAPAFGFGAADPNARARRLARALVSDMVTYHPERRARALAGGTLKREFKEEIRKSWEEYVGQVGPEAARATPHFRDALNELLAGGQIVF